MLQRVLAKLPRGWPVSPTRVGWAAATLRGAPPVASFPACVSPVAGTGHALGGGHLRLAAEIEFEFLLIVAVRLPIRNKALRHRQC